MAQLNQVSAGQGQAGNVSGVENTADIALLRKWAEEPQFGEWQKITISQTISLLEALEADGTPHPSIYQYMMDVENGNREGHGANKFHDDIVEARQLIQALKSGTITARKILGVGAKREEAVAHLEKQISDSLLAISYYGFLSTVNMSNYRWTLSSIQETGHDSSFKTDDEIHHEKAEQIRLDQAREQKILDDKAKAESYFSFKAGEDIKTPQSEILTLYYHIQVADHKTIIEAAELADPGKISEFIRANPSHVKSIGEMKLRDAMSLNRATKSGVKAHRVEFKPRRGYILVEVSTDVSESACKKAMGALLARSGLVTDYSLPFSWENLPKRAIDRIVQRHNGDISLALSEDKDYIDLCITAAKAESEALLDFRQNGPGMVFKSSGSSSYSILTESAYGYRSYAFSNSGLTGYDNYSTVNQAIESIIHYQAKRELVGREVLKEKMQSAEWNSSDELTERLREDAPEQFVAANAEPHYSERIINLLVEDHGWVKESPISATKDVGGGLPGGELNGEGRRLVTASFAGDSRRRFIELHTGFESVFDLDCRDSDPAELSTTFNTRVNKWAAESAASLSSSTVRSSKSEPVRASLESSEDTQFEELAREYSQILGQGEPNEFHRRFAKGFLSKDFEEIEYLANGLNSKGAGFFFSLIGETPPKTQHGMISSMLAWAGISEVEYRARKAKSAYDEFVQKFVKEHGDVGTYLVAWVEHKVGQGFIEICKRGRETWLVSAADGSGYNLSKAGLAKYKKLFIERVKLYEIRCDGVGTEPATQAASSSCLEPHGSDKYLDVVAKLKKRYKMPNHLPIAEGGAPTKYAKLEIMASIKYLGLDPNKMCDRTRCVTKEFIESLRVRNIFNDHHADRQQTHKEPPSSKGQEFDAVLWMDETFAYLKHSEGHWAPDFGSLAGISGDGLLPFIEALTDRNLHAEAAMLRARRLGCGILYSLASDYQKAVAIDSRVTEGNRVAVEKLEVLLGAGEAKLEERLFDWALDHLAFPGEVSALNDGVDSVTSNVFVERDSTSVSVRLRGVNAVFTGATEDDVIRALSRSWDFCKGAYLAAAFPAINPVQAARLSELVVGGAGAKISYGFSTAILGSAILIKNQSETGLDNFSIMNEHGVQQGLSLQQQERVKPLVTALNWEHRFAIQSIHMAVPVAGNQLGSDADAANHTAMSMTA